MSLLTKRVYNRGTWTTFTFMHLSDAFIQSDFIPYSAFRLYICCQYMNYNSLAHTDYVHFIWKWTHGIDCWSSFILYTRLLNIVYGQYSHSHMAFSKSSRFRFREDNHLKPLMDFPPFMDIVFIAERMLKSVNSTIHLCTYVIYLCRK